MVDRLTEIHLPELVLISCGHIEVSFSRNSTFATRVEVPEEGSGVRPVPLVIPTSHPKKIHFSTISKVVATGIRSLPEVHQLAKYFSFCELSMQSISRVLGLFKMVNGFKLCSELRTSVREKRAYLPIMYGTREVMFSTCSVNWSHWAK